MILSLDHGCDGIALKPQLMSFHKGLHDMMPFSNVICFASTTLWIGDSPVAGIGNIFSNCGSRECCIHSFVSRGPRIWVLPESLEHGWGPESLGFDILCLQWNPRQCCKPKSQWQVLGRWFFPGPFGSDDVNTIWYRPLESSVLLAFDSCPRRRRLDPVFNL